MTTRTDLTVAWELSPRIITIAAPSIPITCQDIVDTLRVLEDDLDEGLQFDQLLNASGKGDIGGGSFTGILASLNNAQFIFAPRTTKLESGTVTTPDTAGKTLTDSTALFVTAGVTRGDMVRNATDGSFATVLSVVSETALTTLSLAGGVDNRYDSADAYDVYDFAECSITGGDLVAVDSLGAPLVPYLNTFGTNITVELSTSPALIEAGTSGLTPTESTQLNDINAQLASIEGTFTHQQAMRIVLAALAGKLSGAGSPTVTFRDTGDNKDRIIATIDTGKNRTAVILDAS